MIDLLIRYFQIKISHILIDTAEFEHLDKLFQDIGNCAQENVDYFADKEKRDFIQSFQAIINVIEPLQISLGVVTNCCDKFDINPNCKGKNYI